MFAKQTRYEVARGRRGVRNINILFHSASPFYSLLIRQPALRKLRLSATFSHKRRLNRAVDPRAATDECAAVTDTTLDRRQLVAGTHGPYKQER